VEQSVRVAIISDSESQRTNLQQLLEGNGMVVATSKHFEEGCLQNFEQHNANVLLLDLDDNNDYELDFLDEILNSSLPVLFNENSSTRSFATDGDSIWARKLVGKLAAMAQVVIDSQEAAATEEEVVEEPAPEAAIQAEPEPAPPVTNSVYRVVEGLIPMQGESVEVDQAAVVVEQSSDRCVRRAVAIEIANTNHGAAEPVIVFQLTVEITFGVADFLVSYYRGVTVEEQHPHGAAVQATAVIIKRGAHGDVRDLIAVDVSEMGHGDAETVGGVEVPGESAFGTADLVMRLHRSVRVQKQHPQGAAALVGSVCPDVQLGQTVSVQIAGRS